MASTETPQQTGQPHLQKQDLATLDITKLTPQSPEVISRQATINIGTIGHVAHGKSTVVKAISSVHTVRFKNELERNITIKLDDVIVLDDSNEDHEPDNNNIKNALESNNNINNKTKLPNGIEEFFPVVKLEKLSKTKIYELTKHRDHQQNLRSYIRQKRMENRVSQEFQKRKRRRDDNNVDTQIKLQAIQQFLDYQSGSDHHLKYSGDFEFYKPMKKRRFSEGISRYSIDRSETSSISGSSISNENYRPRRSLRSPERFKFEVKKENKIKRKSCTDLNASYTVEKICGINVVNHDILFYVKWENYSSKSNTWEPLDNIRGCEQLALEFVDEELNNLEDDYKKIIEEFLEEQKDMIETYKTKLKSVVMDEIEKKFDPFEFRCSQLLYMYVRHHNGYYLNFRKRFRQLIVLNHFMELDKQQKAAHDKIRKEIMKKEKNEFQLEIENNVDFSIFESFAYTRENILPKNLNITFEDLKLGCSCTNGCDRMSSCCPKIMDGNFAYTKYVESNRLRLNNSEMIFECNGACGCDENCLNRLTQQPRKIPFKIFKTYNGRGWGLKAVKPILRGSYIVEYTGEIIDQEESIRRGAKYDEIGKSYLFDLDFNEKSEAVYTIDAAHYGNLARLINHSCEPNCRIWPVATCNHDTTIYRLCIFASRKIKAGEELTIDYSGGTIMNDDCDSDDDENSENNEFLDVSHSGNISHKHKTLDVCKCGSKYCKGKIFA